MKLRSSNTFTTIHTEGALLPVDLLQRIAEGDAELGGLTPAAYHLAGGEKLNEVINRSWNRLLGAWNGFQAALAQLPASDPGTTVTRERWLLILFQELGYGRLLTARALEIGGKSYSISHWWHHTPIHLVGCRIDLDRRTAGVAGAARTSPHSLVQELLNRSEAHLWGLVSNGLRLRLLRDNVSLTRQAFVEFDLEAMFRGEVYADFVLLWLLCHQSRVEADRPVECWLEKWARTAQEQGTRALDQLRHGVEEAINALGRGFLSHPANHPLRAKLQSGVLSAQQYYRQLLRLVYRLLFLFVAEDRDLLLDPQADPVIRGRYTRFYSTARLRRLAERQRGTRHTDLFYGLQLVMQKLGSASGCPELGLPPLGSFLFSTQALPDLEESVLSNDDLLEAIRSLSLTSDGHRRRPVDYKNLGSEELGSVYESLLELHPVLNIHAGTFALATAGGHERKTTGSYYTHSSLIRSLLDSALEPVLQEAIKKPDPEAALLNLKICDPACGSGHFLLAAAHRMARHLAAVRTGEEELPPQAIRSALREVIGRCLYGVDVNEMAVELCKVALWMEALEPGKPLSFLDHRILCGNSLLGTTPALMKQGIPDAAFQPIEGDDKSVVSALRKQNRDERAGQTTLFAAFVAEAEGVYGSLADRAALLDAIDDSSFQGIRQKEEGYLRLVQSAEYRQARLLADAWCAAFVWPKTSQAPPPVTQEMFFRLEREPEQVPAATLAEINRLATQYKFLHWHLAFPDIFRLPREGVNRTTLRSAPGVNETTLRSAPDEEPENEQAGWSGGFDVVLGNPPWERIKLQEKEWFAMRRPEIASAPNAAARRRMIAALRSEDPALYAAFQEDRRQAEGESHFVRDSGRYPLCGRGDINTYTIFAETMRLILSATGRVGCIVPSGIATDDTTKFFFQDLMEKRSLVSLYDFENRGGIFPGVHRSYKFCLLTLTGSHRPATRGAEFLFFAHRTEDLLEEERRFTLTVEDLVLLNPNTRTCPIFRSTRDAKLTKAIYRRVPVLMQEGPPEENPWDVKFMAMFHMANDSHLFRTRAQLEAEGWRLEGNCFQKEEYGVRIADKTISDFGCRNSDLTSQIQNRKSKIREDESYLPLYEAKMLHHFDHRWATYDGLETRDLTETEKADPAVTALPRYWVPAGEVAKRLQGKWDRPWLLGWRDICRSTDERTVIASVLPRVGVGDKFLLMLPSQQPLHLVALLSNLDSFAFDYTARQKIGGTSLKYFTMKQLPLLPPSTYDQPCPWSPA